MMEDQEFEDRAAIAVLTALVNNPQGNSAILQGTSIPGQPGAANLVATTYKVVDVLKAERSKRIQQAKVHVGGKVPKT